MHCTLECSVIIIIFRWTFSFVSGHLPSNSSIATHPTPIHPQSPALNLFWLMFGFFSVSCMSVLICPQQINSIYERFFAIVIAVSIAVSLSTSSLADANIWWYTFYCIVVFRFTLLSYVLCVYVCSFPSLSHKRQTSSSGIYRGSAVCSASSKDATGAKWWKKAPCNGIKCSRNTHGEHGGKNAFMEDERTNEQKKTGKANSKQKMYMCTCIRTIEELVYAWTAGFFLFGRFFFNAELIPPMDAGSFHCYFPNSTQRSPAHS